MGVGICDKCIKKYYQKINIQKSGMILGSWTCQKCGAWPARGYYGWDIDEFEERYRRFVTWLPYHRRTMGKRKGGVR